MTPCRRANILRRRRDALKDIAQVDDHDAALFLRPEEFDLFQFAFQIGEESLKLLLGRRRRSLRLGKRQFTAGALEPFVADDHHRLRQVE